MYSTMRAGEGNFRHDQSPVSAASGPLVSALLGITTTIGYGTLYYAFGVLAADMAADTGFSLTEVYGLFSATLAVAGLAAPSAGRLMDRINPALAMAGGSAASAAALALWALVPGQAAFALFLCAVQVVSVMALYEAAFVVAAHAAAPGRARRVITGITFIAGFASTIFWPLTHRMAGFMGWREIYLAYAGLHLVVCLPLHLVLARRISASGAHGQQKAATDPVGAAKPSGKINPASRKLFGFLLVAFSMNSFVISAVHLHLISLLGGLGLGASAALIGAWIGPFQVAARLVEFASASRTSIHVPAILSALALPTGLAVLALGAPALVPAFAFAAIFGAGQGLSFIVRGVLPLEVFGTQGYGKLTGRLNSARLFISAFAPFAMAAVIEHAGLKAGIAMLIGAGLASAASLVVVARQAAGR